MHRLFLFFIHLRNEYLCWRMFGFIPDHAYGVRDKYFPTEIQQQAGQLVLRRLKNAYEKASNAVDDTEMGINNPTTPEHMYVLERIRDDAFDRLFKATRLALLFGVVSMQDIAEEVAAILNPNSTLMEE